MASTPTAGWTAGDWRRRRRLAGQLDIGVDATGGLDSYWNHHCFFMACEIGKGNGGKPRQTKNKDEGTEKHGVGKGKEIRWPLWFSVSLLAKCSGVHVRSVWNAPSKPNQLWHDMMEKV